MTDKKRQYMVSQAYASHYGPEIRGGAVTFTACADPGEAVSLLLYRKGEKEPEAEFPMEASPVQGNFRGLRVSDLKPGEFEYNFRIGGKVVQDPAAQVIVGKGHFGDRTLPQEHEIRCACAGPFDWGDDRMPCLTSQETVAYYLHVRGFTMQKGSGVRKRGTFAGIREKIPYLKDLGVNQIIMMPAYEFTEWNNERGNEKINYWGYTGGWFFAPKSAYSCGQPADELRTLVKSLHQERMELIMEFAFPDSTDPLFAAECLQYWQRTYHIDGFRLMTSGELVHAMMVCPFFSRAKLITGYTDEPLCERRKQHGYLPPADYNDGFRDTARKLLKGDENQLASFTAMMKRTSPQRIQMNYVTGHDGFTLMDLVSYDTKHNEANGENGQDGAPSEFSWSCGAEGPTRKKTIRSLRLQQMKNAYTMLMLGKGVPVLLAGDEHANTQSGNSNPYCQDNEVTWLDWNKDAFAGQLFPFVKELIAFRKAHDVITDFTEPVSTGTYPSFSSHSNKAWYGAEEYNNRHIGLMYCRQRPGEESYLYAAFNLHWDPQLFALPYLPEGYEWFVCLDTSGAEKTKMGEERQEREIMVPGRTIYLLEGRAVKKTDGAKPSGKSKRKPAAG